MTEFRGERLPDTKRGDLPNGWREPGSYWRILDSSGKPMAKKAAGKRTVQCWMVTVPMADEDGFALADLSNHTVREHDDGTISVRPGDGSSNSILVRSRFRDQEFSWHGYIERGVFREC